MEFRTNRYREKRDVGHPKVYMAYDQPGQQFMFPLEDAFFTFYETMFYRSEKGRRAKPVRHLKVRARSLYDSGTVWPTQYPGETYRLVGLVPRWSVGLCSYVPTPSDSDWYTHAEKAFREFSTQIPQEVSIANFLWELRDLQELIPQIAVKLSRFELATNGLLWSSFAAKPLVGDLSKLAHLSSIVLSKIENLRRDRGKWSRRAFGTGVQDIRPAIPPNYWESGHASWGHQWWYVLWKQSIQFNAVAYIRHDLDLDGFGAHLRAFMAALGLNNPLSILWEGIPNSFVLDWFLRIQDRLGALTAQPFTGEWTIDNSSISHTAAASVDVHLKNPHTNALHPVGVIDLRLYERLPGLPVPSTLMFDETLSPTQLALGLSLLK